MPNRRLAGLLTSIAVFLGGGVAVEGTVACNPLAMSNNYHPAPGGWSDTCFNYRGGKIC